MSSLKMKFANNFLVLNIWFVDVYTSDGFLYSRSVCGSRETLTRIVRKRGVPSAYRRDVYSVLLKMCASKERKTRTTIKFHGSNSMQFFFDRHAKGAFNKSVVTNANVLRCVFHLKSHREESRKINEKKKEYVGLNIILYNTRILRSLCKSCYCQFSKI